jgi:hypothetical protein
MDTIASSTKEHAAALEKTTEAIAKLVAQSAQSNNQVADKMAQSMAMLAVAQEKKPAKPKAYKIKKTDDGYEVNTNG